MKRIGRQGPCRHSNRMQIARYRIDHSKRSRICQTPIYVCWYYQPSIVFAHWTLIRPIPCNDRLIHQILDNLLAIHAQVLV